MKTRAGLLILLIAAAVGFAADIELADGRVLKDYKIVSQTPTTVLIRYAGGAAKVDKNLLPPAIARQYPIDRKGAVAEAEEAAVKRAAYAAQVKAAEEKRASEAAQRSQATAASAAEIEAARKEGKREAELAQAKAQGKDEVAQAAADKAKQEALVKAHNDQARGIVDPATETKIEELVLDHAKTYFSAQYKQPNSRLTVESNARIEEVRVVPGYTDRYEVTGRSSWTAFESRGTSFDSGMSRFQAEVRREKGRLQVVAFQPR